MSLILPPRYTQQPQGAALLDQAYAAGLACLVNPALGKRELISGIAYTQYIGLFAAKQDGVCQLNTAATGAMATLGSAVSVPAGSDFTAMVRINALDAYAGNNGLFRAATGSDTFCIVRGGTNGWPWLRLNATDVYNAASGPKVPAGRPVTIVFSVRSGNRVDIAWDGKIQHSATFSTTTPAFTFATLGHQSGEPIGDFSLFAFWRRYCDPAMLSANPWQIFKAPARDIWVSTGAGGALSASASGADTASGSASLLAQVALGAVGVALASGSAIPGAAVPLSATGISVASGSAGPVATVTISATGLAQAAGQAGLSAAVLLAAAGAAQAAGNAALAAHLTAQAAGAAQAGGSATLSGGAAGAISATGGDTASGSALLSVTVHLNATGGDTASGSANLTGGAAGAISASGSDTASGSATTSVTVNLTAAGFVQAMGAGQLTVSAQLQAFGSDVAGGHASLSVSSPVSGPFQLSTTATRLSRLTCGARRLTRAATSARRLMALTHKVSHPHV